MCNFISKWSSIFREYIKFCLCSRLARLADDVDGTPPVKILTPAPLLAPHSSTLRSWGTYSQGTDLPRSAHE
jgi:hypothetical protein